MKQKNNQGNTRKQMQTQLAELSGAMGAVYNEIGKLRSYSLGLETIVMHFADFLGKKKDFEKFLEKKLEEQKKEKEKLEKEAEKSKDKEEYKGQEDDTYR